MAIISLIDVDELDPDDTCLIHAIRDGDVEGVKFLIESGTNVNQPNSLGYTPLGEAINQGNLEIVQALLGMGANPNCGSENTPLYVASVKGYAEIVVVLIQAGADLNLSSTDETPLMGAATEGKVNIVQLLVEAGANVNAKTQEGKSALLRAAENGWQIIFNNLAPLTDHKSRKAAEKRLKQGIIYRKRKDDELVSNFVTAAIEGRTSDIQKILKQGVDLNGVNAYGSNALYAAAYWGKMEIIDVLVEAGANLEIQNEESGWTPLMGAIRMNQHATVTALLEKGADPNAWSRNHKVYPSLTPLMIAASYCVEVEIFKELIRHGADVNTKNRYGNTALMIAASDRYSRKRELIINTLIEAKAPVEHLKDIHLLMAIKDGDFEKVKSLIKDGANVNARTYTGDTTLVVASRKGKIEIVETLIEAGAVINAEGLWHPLITAIVHGKTEVACLLLQSGADVNAKDPDGLSAIKCAKQQSDSEVIKLLKRIKSSDI